MQLDKSRQAAFWLSEQLAKAPNSDLEHVQSLNKEETGEHLEGCGFADLIEFTELSRILAWSEKSIHGRSMLLELVQIGKLAYRIRDNKENAVVISPKPPSEGLSKIWKEALASLELPSTKLLLSKQAVLMSLDSKEAVIQVAENWMTMVQSRHHLVEKAMARAIGAPRQIRFRAASVPHFHDSYPPKPSPIIAYPIRIFLGDEERDTEKILSKIVVYQYLPFSKTSFSGFDDNSLNLVIKAWAHFGGDLDELSGDPSYLVQD